MVSIAHPSLVAGEPISSDVAFDDFLNFDWDVDVGDPEKMSSGDLDCLFPDNHSRSNDLPPSNSRDSPTADVQPASSWSQDDSECHLTPSSTNELPNAEDSSFDLISNYTSSPVDQVSPFSARSSDFSHIAAPHSSDAALSPSNRSRESTDGLHSDPIEQQWSFVSNSSGGDYNTTIPVTPHSHVHNIPIQSTGAFNESLLADMNINLVLRPSQQSHPFAAPNLHTNVYGPSWGSLQQQHPAVFHQDISAQPIQHHHAHPAQPHHPMPAYDMTNVQAAVTFGRQPYHGEQLPLPSQPAYMSPTNQPQPSSTTVNTAYKEHNRPKELAYSTRRRFPGRPAVAKQNSPPVPRQNPRPIAAGPSLFAETTHQHQSEDSKRKPPGGRKKGGHLPENTRDKVSKMRKLGACWRCKMQRDPVSSI